MIRNKLGKKYLGTKGLTGTPGLQFKAGPGILDRIYFLGEF